MKYIAIIALTILIATTSFQKNNNYMNDNNGLPLSNPFSSASSLPFQAPPFDRIKNEDYKPALEEGIKQQMKEVEAIANNSAAPTFENTLVALEKSGELLRRVGNVFNTVSGANTNDTLQNLQEEIAPKLAANHDAIYLNEKLFKRVETIYNNRANLKLDKEANRLVEYYYQQFVLAGAKLSAADKEKMKSFNAEEATLKAKFTNQLVNAAKAGALIIKDSNELAGLSQTDKDAFAQNAKAKGLEGTWLIPLQNTTQQPALQSLTNRDTREKLFNASWTRAEKNDSNDNRAIIIRIATIRAQKAKLMGFKNFAELKLQDQMAQTPQAVDNFLNQLVPSVTGKAKQEAADIQALIDKQNGDFQLQPWD